jgi:heterodisulfide reductase subunit C/quinone-modifying oxidoreductase subunit QmoC
MMSIRRWLTAQYDWTGLASKFYTSLKWEVGSMMLLGLLVLLIVALLHGPIVTDSVELNTFAPLSIVHLADWIMAGVLLFFISTNVWRMYSFVIRSNEEIKIPFQVYISEAWRLIYHTLTQKRWLDCAGDDQEEQDRKQNKTTWISHLLMVSGYGLMLVLIVFFPAVVPD